MFEPKQIIEGKIFVHHRRDERLMVHTKHELPAVYFEAFIQAQNFQGHFVELHAEPGDLIHAIYIKKNDKNKIIAFYNQTQQVVHLHPFTLIFSRWSIIHRVLPVLVQIFASLIILLFLLFSVVTAPTTAVQFFQVLLDVLTFSFFGIILFLIGFVIPFVLPYALFKRYRTLALLHLLPLEDEQILAMEKMNPQNRIYPLQK